MYSALRYTSKAFLLLIVLMQLSDYLVLAAPGRRCQRNCPLPIPADIRPVCTNEDIENMCGENQLCGQDQCTSWYCQTTCKCMCSFGMECKRFNHVTFRQPYRGIINDSPIWIFHSGERRCERKPGGTDFFQP
ncbi:uncharacterized protein [Watersipora subatra]|uniref:uncharacterized protein n=1 Tax=Watersipora subatra TaxID=2589382 RepID=UPI00355BB208